MDIIQHQIALFFKNAFVGDYESIILKFKKYFDNHINTVMLPLDNDAPAEIPRAQLFYKDFNINIAKNRIDIFLSPDSTIDSITEKFINFNFSEFDLEIIRIGYVCTYFDSKKSLDTLVDIIDPKKRFKDFKEINLRFNREFNFKDMICNDVEKIDIGQATRKTISGPITENGLIIQKDINTSEHNRDVLSRERIKIFVNELKSKAKSFYMFEGADD